MAVCKCIVPLQHGGTLNNRRAARSSRKVGGRGRELAIPVYRLQGFFEKDPLTSGIVILIDFSSNFPKHPYDNQVPKKDHQLAKIAIN
ncbi:hypothetical protein TNCV_671341 [Trichonephila clavipes]|nr:hypothetical protein TNCV_671341 [Trichonephila clavipes]